MRSKTSFTLSTHSKETLDVLAAELDTSRTAVLELSIREFEKRHNAKRQKENARILKQRIAAKRMERQAK